MSRFQAQTNAVLDEQLEHLRERLGIRPNQKAELLREIADLAAWILTQAERGRSVEARGPDGVEPLVHPVVDRLRRGGRAPERLRLSNSEVEKLSAVLERGFEPASALRDALGRMASPRRKPPKLEWHDPER